MSLFFETSSQAACFLYMLPVGFGLALCLELGSVNRWIRPLTDVFVLIAAGTAVLAGIVLCRETSLRLYHLLGVMVGALLFTQGIGKIIRQLVRRQESRRRAAK